MSSQTDHTNREICGLCHRVSPVGFWVPDDIWESVVRPAHRHTVHCLTCFLIRADEKMIRWDERIKFFPVSFASHRDPSFEGPMQQHISTSILRKSARDLLNLVEHANRGAWKNGVHGPTGEDEGDSIAARIISEIKDIIS